MYAITTTAGDQAFEQGAGYENLAEARLTAETMTLEQGVELIIVHQGTGAVAFVTTPVPAGVYFKPWQRIENPKFQAPTFAGWVPAYTRKRIQATAYRKADGGAWLIHDGRTGNTRQVANTTEGRLLFTAMRNGEML